MPDLAETLRRALDEHEQTSNAEALEERLARLEAGAGGDLDAKKLLAAVKGLSPAERREFTDLLAEAIDEGREPDLEEIREEVDDDDDQADDDEPAARRRTRPGRKKGGVYDFDVDDDGRVIDLRGQPARIYSGEDEPDRVELPEEREPEADVDDDAADDEEADAA